MLASIRAGKTKQVKLKSNDKTAEDGASRAMEKAKAAKANATTDSEKVREAIFAKGVRGRRGGDLGGGKKGISFPFNVS